MWSQPQEESGHQRPRRDALATSMAVEEVVVLMVPLPAQGHLNQHLHLARRLSSRGLPVHYFCSATHNRQAKSRVHGWDSTTSPPIHFHDFPLPSDLPLLPPNPNSPTKFPTHLIPLFASADSNLRLPFTALLRRLSSNTHRVVVIYDSPMSFAAQEASLLPNVEAYTFYSGSAFSLLYTEAESEAESSLQDVNNINVVFNNNITLNELLGRRASMKESMPEEFFQLLSNSRVVNRVASGILCNTCEALDAECLLHFMNLPKAPSHRLQSHKYWALGPLNPISPTPTTPRHRCLAWLDHQPKDSVIYVSFGTMTSVPDEQIVELALGLEQSGQRFIWVVRNADQADIYASNKTGRMNNLPDGFEERVKERGLVEREWAPQLEILAHPSTSGFVSHCGWNSCVESLSMGVPMAAWPMHSDQPMNTILVTEVLRVGLVARDWADRDNVAKAESVAKVVKRLMVEEEGRVVRKRARELGVDVREAARKGEEMDRFVDYICRA
ncbi:hypothetical protein Scep_003848 [Stephania cephalantha]|uniref:Glycosyltransferase n=1 Tax=Stephania cephalantha TaxID=152367 RepID=A0AAP0KU26_9MAGN